MPEEAISPRRPASRRGDLLSMCPSTPTSGRRAIASIPQSRGDVKRCSTTKRSVYAQRRSSQKRCSPWNIGAVLTTYNLRSKARRVYGPILLLSLAYKSYNAQAHSCQVPGGFFRSWQCHYILRASIRTIYRVSCIMVMSSHNAGNSTAHSVRLTRQILLHYGEAEAELPRGAGGGPARWQELRSCPTVMQENP